MFNYLKEKTMFDVDYPINTINISDMKPYDIGIITSCPDSDYIGKLVMRTANINGDIEVMSLSYQNDNGSCWTFKPTVDNPLIQVKLLEKGSKITLTVK